jgi:hypothetical protein
MSKALRTFIRESILESSHLHSLPLREFGGIVGALGAGASFAKGAYDEFFGDDDEKTPASVMAQEDVKAVSINDISKDDLDKIRAEIDKGLSKATKNMLYDASMMQSNAGVIISDITRRITEDGDAGLVMSSNDYGDFFKNVAELLAQDAADGVGYPYRTGLYVISWTGEDETLLASARDTGSSIVSYYVNGMVTYPMAVLKTILGGAADAYSAVGGALQEARSSSSRKNRATRRSEFSIHSNIIQEGPGLAFLSHIPGLSTAVRAGTVATGRAVRGGIQRAGLPFEYIAAKAPSWASFSALVKTTPSVIDDAIKHPDVAASLTKFTQDVAALVPVGAPRRSPRAGVTPPPDTGWTAADAKAFIKAMIKIDADESTIQNTLSYAFRNRAGGNDASLLEARVDALTREMAAVTGEPGAVVKKKVDLYIAELKKSPTYINSLDEVVRAVFDRITRVKFNVGPVNVGGQTADALGAYISTLVTCSYLFGLAELIADKDKLLPLTPAETTGVWQVYSIRDASAKAVNNFRGWEDVYFATTEESDAVARFRTGNATGTAILDDLKAILTDSIPGLRVVAVGEMTDLSNSFAGLASEFNIGTDLDAAAASRPGGAAPKKDRAAARPDRVPVLEPQYTPGKQ